MESWELERSTNLGSARRRINGDPKQGDGDGDEARPDEDDGGRPPPPPHQPLGKRPEMHYHPQAKEDSPHQPAPLRYLTVYRPAHSHCRSYDVGHHDGDRRDHQRRPLDEVELRELVAGVVGCGLGRQGEGDVDAGDDFEEALQDGG